MGLAHPRRREGPVLALEPEQRLEHESRDPRLERMPDHLCSGSVLAAVRDRRGRLSRGLGPEPDVHERPRVLRHWLTARTPLRRSAVPRPLFLPGARSSRPQGPICRLLAAKRRSRADQSRALRAQSARLQRLRPRLLGAHRKRRSSGLSRACARQRSRRDLADRRARLVPLRARALHAGAPAFLSPARATGSGASTASSTRSARRTTGTRPRIWRSTRGRSW